MKSAETLLACCVVGLGCFIGGQSMGARRATTASEAAGIVAPRVAATSAKRIRANPTIDVAAARTDNIDDRRDGDAKRDRVRLSPAEMRRRVAMGMAGTYVDELLLARDSALARWPDRGTRPLRVWVSEANQLGGWNAEFLGAVRDAFSTWEQAGVPVRFTFVPDSARAEVHVTFRNKFASGISGKTVWSRDMNWWLVSSDIQLALDHPAGGSVSAPQMRAIALHEVGHLLGLDHSSNPDHIMSSSVRVRELSDTDRATMRLLYSLPAGSLKD